MGGTARTHIHHPSTTLAASRPFGKRVYGYPELMCHAQLLSMPRLPAIHHFAEEKGYKWVAGDEWK
jgi:hypothetical protein